MTTTLAFCSATSQKHTCVNSRFVTPSSSLSLPFLCVYPSFPERFYGYFSFLCYATHASVLFLLYCSSNPSSPQISLSPSHSDPVTYICFDLPVLYFAIDLLAMGTSLFRIPFADFFAENLHPSIIPSLRLLSLFSSPFPSLSVSLGKAAFRLGFSRPRCEFWRRIDQRSFRCQSLPIGQILHPIPPERNLVLPVSLPSSFPSSRTTLAERRTLRQPKISNSIEGKFGGGAGQ